MNEILEFLSGFEDGASEEQLCGRFSRMKKIELAAILNSLLRSNQIEINDAQGRILYRAVKNKAADYEAMVLALLGQTGATGMWLRDIKVKTNIPHNLILKILRSLEGSRKIKSLKSIKNNRKMYMLFDVKPAEEVTGGVWFSNNDVDLVFVNKLMDIIHRYVSKKGEPPALPRMDSLTTLSELREFIASSRVSEVDLSASDLNTLVDCLVFDGRIERYSVEGDVALRCLPEDYLDRAGGST